MKLYYSVPSSSSRRILVALALKGIRCDGERILLTDAASLEALSRKSPMGQVPVLEVHTPTGPAYLSQSVAIAEYLDEVHPEPPLLGSDPVSRARVREIVLLVTSGIQPLHNMKTLAEVKRLGGDEAVVEWTRHFVQRGLRALEALAARESGPFMVCAEPTLADVFVASQLDLVRARGVDDLADYPALRRVEASCLALDAFAKPPEPS